MAKPLRQDRSWPVTVCSAVPSDLEQRIAHFAVHLLPDGHQFGLAHLYGTRNRLPWIVLLVPFAIGFIMQHPALREVRDVAEGSRRTGRGS
jgi:hypothetical protein